MGELGALCLVGFSPLIEGAYSFYWVSLLGMHEVIGPGIEKAALLDIIIICYGENGLETQ